MLKNMPHVMFAAVLIAACMFIGFASAAELTVEAPYGSYKAGDVISIPVIFNNDIDFAGFYATVNNNMPGVSVSIRKDPSINWAMFESRENPSQHKVIGFVVSPIYDEKVPLFIVDLVVNDENVKSIPLKIVLEEIISNSQGDISLDTIKKVDLSGIKLSDDLTMSFESDTGDFLKTPEPTAVQTTSSTQAGSGKSPGFAAGIIIGGLAAAYGLLNSRKFR